jgi:hypothetical protein
MTIIWRWWLFTVHAACKCHKKGKKGQKTSQDDHSSMLIIHSKNIFPSCSACSCLVPVMYSPSQPSWYYKCLPSFEFWTYLHLFWTTYASCPTDENVCTSFCYVNAWNLKLQSQQWNVDERSAYNEDCHNIKSKTQTAPGKQLLWLLSNVKVIRRGPRPPGSRQARARTTALIACSVQTNTERGHRWTCTVFFP